MTNVWVMLPFVRTTWEVEKVLEIMAEEGLVSGKDFKIWIMAEVPSVIFLAEEFCKYVDGFSIGSNDLTQLILGADRDSGILEAMGYFDERDPAVTRAIAHLNRSGSSAWENSFYLWTGTLCIPRIYGIFGAVRHRQHQR